MEQNNLCPSYGYKMFTNQSLLFCSQTSQNNSSHSPFLFILQSLVIWLLPSLFYWKGSLSFPVSFLLLNPGTFSSFLYYLKVFPYLVSLLSFSSGSSNTLPFFLIFLSWPLFLQKTASHWFFLEFPSQNSFSSPYQNPWLQLLPAANPYHKPNVYQTSISNCMLFN